MVKNIVAVLALVASGAFAQQPFKEMDTPYVPTPQVVVERMLSMAAVRSGEKLIDLGSGDGRLVITAAKEYGAHGFGVDIDPRLVSRSNQAAEQAGVADRVKFLKQDLFDTDFHDADVLTLYLLPDVNLALRPKILSELRPGTRVVSHDYGMRDWQPDAEAKVPAPDKSVGLRKESMVYLWIVPARVEGDWDVDAGGKRILLSLAQKFQKLSGSVHGAGGEAALGDVRLRGADVRLMLPAGAYGSEPVELQGRASGDTIEGRIVGGGRQIGTFKARRRA
ncbi:MAG TPA: methyltransferase domain-containing protein [Burkholderiales bacterium]